MKVLVVNRHMDTILGGSEIQCDLIARKLLEFGHQVSYLALQSKKTLSHEYNVINMEKFTRRAFHKVISSEKPDIVYWRYNKKHLYVSSQICRRANVKFIYSLSHINDVTKWSDQDIYRIKNGSIIGRIKGIGNIIVNRVNYSALKTVDGIASQKADYLEQLPKSFDKRAAIYIRNSMEIKPQGNFVWKKPYVVWVANIKRPKRPECFIELARRLPHLDVDFIMIGKIQDHNYDYMNYSNNLPDNLYYLGSKTKEETDEIIGKSLFLVHTCEPEGFPNNLIQAWLSGKPTITMQYDPDSTIEKYRIGLVSGTFEQLIDDVNKLIDDKKMRNEMGDRALQYANDSFNPETNVRKLETLMEYLSRKG